MASAKLVSSFETRIVFYYSGYLFKAFIYCTNSERILVSLSKITAEPIIVSHKEILRDNALSVLVSAFRASTSSSLHVIDFACRAIVWLTNCYLNYAS